MSMASAPIAELTADGLRGLGVKELKQLCKDNGIESTNFLEKRDFLTALLPLIADANVQAVQPQTLQENLRSAIAAGPLRLVFLDVDGVLNTTPRGTHHSAGSAASLDDICVSRLAGFLQEAGVHVVLSSSWRKSTHHKRVEALEAALSKHSGRAVSFEARTRPGGDEPEKRLELIGDFVAEYSQNRQHPDLPLRVLVLEDFAATHPRQWKFHEQIRSLEAVEGYWRQRSAQPDKTSVKLVHCFEEWSTSFGQPVAIGSGLTCAKVCEAQRFLLEKPPWGSEGLYCKFCAAKGNPMSTSDSGVRSV